IPRNYIQYKNAFNENICKNLPSHSLFDCKVTFIGGIPHDIAPVQQLSSEEISALKKHLNEFLRNGFIRKSHSCISHPIKFKRMKDGELQVCVDFKKYENNLAKMDSNLPTIPIIYENLRGASVFTRINIKSAFN
ncbi:hypothetical protein PIROE2DRAFT_33922, partial [Piromyces sp. E2]